MESSAKLSNYEKRHDYRDTTLQFISQSAIIFAHFSIISFSCILLILLAIWVDMHGIIIKDMSRLGRDYLKVGQVMEILRQRGVRLIAINDGVDSANGENDFTPFLNIMYEFYARDTSRKIKSVFKAKGMSGKHLTGTVIYGYLWDENREHRIVDEKAADVVRRIFTMKVRHRLGGMNSGMPSAPA